MGAARFDRTPLVAWEWTARLVLAVLVMVANPLVHGPALVAAGALLALQVYGSRASPAPMETTLP